MSTRKRYAAIYEDRRFRVTSADIKTPSAYYPVADTVGRIRRDILFWAIAYAGLTGTALWLYGDLWHAHEMLIMGGSIGLALLIGTQVSILQLDARGFPARFFVARTTTVRAIFEAITRARAMQRDRGAIGDVWPPEGTNTDEVS